MIANFKIADIEFHYNSFRITLLLRTSTGENSLEIPMMPLRRGCLATWYKQARHHKTQDGSHGLKLFLTCAASSRDFEGRMETIKDRWSTA